MVLGGHGHHDPDEHGAVGTDRSNSNINDHRPPNREEALICQLAVGSH